jgi:hypothetical protein|tara:strand:+ start:3486 stop:4517 length:1032 start_codon:yes stop_codon:yes gene_type:complete
MERIQFGTLSTPSCPVDSYIEKFLESSEAPEIQVDCKQYDSLTKALSNLEKGKLDLLALPARILHGKQLKMHQANCEVLGARTPRTPNMVLVSENKIQYQPKSGIILSESTLVRRQLRRSRRGLRVLSPKAFIEIEKREKNYENELEMYSWMETLRENKEIDGYVIPRVIYSTLNISERRHTLLPDPHNLGDDHFLPSPYSDLVVIIGRKKYPKKITSLFSEVEGETMWRIQDYFIGGVDENHLENIGMLTRHRKMSTLMTLAEKHKDLTMEQAFHNSEGEATTNEVLVEFRIETISNDGRRTIAVDRVVPYSKYEIAMVATEKDWRMVIERAKTDGIDFFNN